MKKLVQYKLKILAKWILAKYKPEIIGITGSVGKTSAKEAVFSVLDEKFKVRKNIKNYNNEIGVPITIIGAQSPGKSLFGWFKVFFRAISLLIFKDENYPKILILEMAADKPGDIKYLTNFVKCKIGIITIIGQSHLEFFRSIEKIKEEKTVLVKSLAKTSYAILNYDDVLVKSIAPEIKAKIVTYGLSEGADIRAQEISMKFDQNIINSGITFKLTYNGSFVPVFLPKILSQTGVYSALAGAAAGIIYGMNLVEISEKLKSFTPPKGRMNLIKGIKSTLIIDDTYNSSPQSSLPALETLVKIPGKNKYAVLGDMLELGSYTEQGHKTVGEAVASNKIDFLIAIGEKARDIARGAEKAGMDKNKIFHFDTADEAGKFIQDRITTGDIILVKGSQGARLEKIVKEIMAEPLRAKELLVRQEEEWEKK